jgi:hypothetical protein
LARRLRSFRGHYEWLSATVGATFCLDRTHRDVDQPGARRSTRSSRDSSPPKPAPRVGLGYALATGCSVVRRRCRLGRPGRSHRLVSPIRHDGDRVELVAVRGHTGYEGLTVLDREPGWGHGVVTVSHGFVSLLRKGNSGVLFLGPYAHRREPYRVVTGGWVFARVRAASRQGITGVDRTKEVELHLNLHLLDR